MSVIAFILCILSILYVYSKQVIINRNRLNEYKKQIQTLSNSVPLSHFNQMLHNKESELRIISQELSNFKEELESLKSQQQSKSVRLGLISENVLPFHEDFKYNVKDLVPMFRPIDYIVFTEDEIVFLEIKVGTSQLSPKQKRIKSLIELGKVRFEEHRVTETGYFIKESYGKKEES
jgi:predicted Holliday junction resolvase-like endonuclease